MSNQNANEMDPRHFVLSAEQQNVLLNALNVPNPLLAQSNSVQPQATQSSAVDPLFPFDYGFNPDSSFDFDFSGEGATLLGDNSMLSNQSDAEDDDSPTKDGNEKRPLPEDVAQDNDASKSATKKRETIKPEKVPKKPGRKPLTEEPTTKRKAQNRAAQRAFRERKEKHVKDLETKVEELLKASEETATENTALRSQIERLTSELESYKKALQSQQAPPRPRGFGAAAVSNIPDINFQFDFPRFGSLPGSSSGTHARSHSQSQVLASPSYGQQSHQSHNSMSSSTSPMTENRQTFHHNNNDHNNNTNSIQNKAAANSNSDSHTQQDLAQFSNVFSPAPSTQSQGKQGSGSSSGNAAYGATSSPSTSSNSNPGTISSCGTSPEPFNQSPMSLNKSMDSLATIGEETSPIALSRPGLNGFATLDMNLEWLSQQNGGQFDPQLFGDYREPQENILNYGFDDKALFDTLENSDFLAPYNQPAIMPQLSHKPNNLIEQIDAQKEIDDLPVLDGEQKLPCNQLWDKLQKCPKVQAGEFDLDSLCNELQKKATCGGKGPVVKEVDFNTILDKYLGKKCAEGFKKQQAADVAK